MLFVSTLWITSPPLTIIAEEQVEASHPVVPVSTSLNQNFAHSSYLQKGKIGQKLKAWYGESTSHDSETLTTGHVITNSFLNFNCTQITHKLKHMETVKLFLIFHVFSYILLSLLKHVTL